MAGECFDDGLAVSVSPAPRYSSPRLVQRLYSEFDGTNCSDLKSTRFWLQRADDLLSSGVALVLAGALALALVTRFALEVGSIRDLCGSNCSWNGIDSRLRCGMICSG